VYLLQHILLPKAANSKASKQVFETPGLKLKLKLKGAFKALQQKGIKITDYKEDVDDYNSQVFRCKRQSLSGLSLDSL
jgi:predicted GNAT superfamily acetyltransferase